ETPSQSVLLLDEAEKAADEILGLDIDGHTVNKLLVAEKIDYEDELYLGIVFDRGEQTNVIMGCSEGGVDIETLADERPEAIHKEWADPELGFRDYQLRRLAYEIAPHRDHGRAIASVARKLVDVYQDRDANVAEINPLVTHSDGSVTALDAKMNFDDNALFRHPDIEELRDPDEEDPLEAKTREADLHYVRLDGSIGIIGNGAGLVMTTLDVVDRAGGKPANFLDIGGSSSPEKVKTALEVLLENEKTESILINVFGGITRCDDVAKGLIQAVEDLGIELPIVVRLTGTNEEKGKQLLQESGIDLVACTSMEEAADEAVQRAGAAVAQN
ncbi:MAG: ADP-forming succinate--CoA ligase subunit beta, partial [bacterium]